MSYRYSNSIPLFTYNSSKFPTCEKCGSSNLAPLLFYNDSVYRCITCGFQKSTSHVSFGFHFKIPRYHSLTNTHSADKLFCIDGTRLSTRIDEPYTSFPSPKRTKHLWDTWIKEHTIEIIELAAIAENHILGCDHQKIHEDFNPLNFLTEAIRDQKGRYLNLLTMRSDVRHRKNKISDAIQYGVKNSDSVMYIGPSSKESKYCNFLENTCIRFHKQFKHFPNFKHFVDNEPSMPSNTNTLFITGPNIYICKKYGYDQGQLDRYFDKFLTKLEQSLKEDQKLRVIINTGNSGVDTSVIRWAINNNKYSAVVNTKNFYFVDEQNSVYSSSEEETINRLMDIKINNRTSIDLGKFI